MIDSIETVRNLGRFDNFVRQNDTTDFTKYNLILGYNGSGKSILSNALRLFSNQESDGGQSLFDSLSAGQDDASVVVKIDGKKVPFKVSSNKLPLYVFNSDFTSEHVFRGTTFNFKPFDLSVVTKDQLTNPAIAAIESQIDQVRKRIELKSKEKEFIEQRFDEIKKGMSREHNNRIRGSRMPSFNIPPSTKVGESANLRSALDGLFKDYDISQKQDELEKDVTLVKQMAFTDPSINANNIQKVLNKSVSEEARKSVEKRIKKWEECRIHHGSVVQWFENGYELLKHSQSSEDRVCPLCGLKISDLISSLIRDYGVYFSKEYASLVIELEEIEQNLNNEIDTLLKNAKSLQELNTLIERYRSRAEKPIQTIESRSDRVRDVLKELLKLVKRKKAKIDLQGLIVGEGDSDVAREYRNDIKSAQASRKRLLVILEASVIDPEEVVGRIREIIPLCCYAQMNEDSEGHQLDKYSKLSKDLERDLNTMRDLAAKRTNEIASLRKESQYVNSFLRRLGIAHFEIAIERNEGTENMIVQYIGGQVRKELKHSLSEGEKTALAFAYFLSKFKYEIHDNSKTNASPVTAVIDDPVSSLDEDRLHSTACLIHEQLGDCQQLFVFSHNITFMRFLSSVIGSPRTEPGHTGIPLRRDYYLCSHDGTLKNLPKQLRNYSTSYFQKLDDIRRFSAGVVSYEVAKAYIPSYIRVVLESFFSFKLSLLSQGSSGESTQSAGLDKIIANIRGMIGVFSRFKKVGDVDAGTLVDDLRNIKRITDPQVHGTPNDVTDLRVISESELRSLARKTLDIIRFVDALHADRAIAKPAL